MTRFLLTRPRFRNGPAVPPSYFPSEENYLSAPNSLNIPTAYDLTSKTLGMDLIEQLVTIYSDFPVAGAPTPNPNTINTDPYLS